LALIPVVQRVWRGRFTFRSHALENSTLRSCFNGLFSPRDGFKPAQAGSATRQVPMTRLFATAILVSLTAASGWAQSPPPPQFAPGAIRRSEDLPAGRLRSQLERLPGPARDRAVAWLGSIHFTELDLQTLQVDPSGGIYFADPAPVEPPDSDPAPPPPTAEAAVPVEPFPSGLVFHSRPGAPNVLYLDFTGEDVEGTACIKTTR
jgi:hypothetical protein